MNIDVETFLKGCGVGHCHPKNEFFEDGTKACEVLKSFGVVEVDDEDFLHRSFQTFSCHVPGCASSFDTVLQYEQHYNSCHRFTCSQCSKSLPSSHFLDLHLMEVHDAFFKAQAEKKPMFQCFIEDCNNVFKNPQLRRDHCISFHKFPSDFRFDEARKHSLPSKNSKRKTKSKTNPLKVDNSLENSTMEVVEEEQMGSPSITVKTKKKSQNMNRGRRKPVLSNFSKDLRDNLPE